MSRDTTLTERQRKFVAEYRGQGDGLRAARAAGFKGDDATVRVSASRLMKHAGVKAAIEAKRARRRKPSASSGAVGTHAWGLEQLADVVANPAQPGAFAKIRAVELALRLTGEIGRGRYEPPRGDSATGDPEPELEGAAAATTPAAHEEPGIVVPPRLRLERGGKGG